MSLQKSLEQGERNFKDYTTWAAKIILCARSPNSNPSDELFTAGWETVEELMALVFFKPRRTKWPFDFQKMKVEAISFWKMEGNRIFFYEKDAIDE